ncbi:MAG: DNA methyltransferase, partial [Candidatus Rokuibacteriota bacterium]
MPLTGEEIRSRLGDFAAKWSVYEGTERSEAQTFLTQLFACYGTERESVATFEEPQHGGFIDLLWPRVCLFEMKRPAEANRLDRHRAQALQYWGNCADPERNIPAPTYVVLCAFKKLEIWQPGSFPDQPRTELDLIELPDRYETLLFLAGREPVFAGGHEELTRETVTRVVEVYQRLRERQAAPAEVLRDFILQIVWCMFAEDLGQIEAQLFTRLLDRLLEDRQRSSIEDLGQLFAYLNTQDGGPGHGLYAGVRYANGGLFREPARVHLEADELAVLRMACESDWTRVQPSIFGSLMEGGLGHDMQWALGAHYTHEADIRKVVTPTIVRPWEERIENITTHAEAVQAQNDLMNYVVLDPACGSGNFLYVAYRELRRLEKRLRGREAELRRAAGMRDREQGALSLFFPLSNVQGIEVNGFAVAVARVTLWMGHKLTVDELGLDEATLPLADLSGIQQGDALRMRWPRTDAIVGNPPFHGDRFLRGLLGDAYVEWLRREFGVGIKDYCVYWFRKAHDHLDDGQRAGLVGTNSISQNRGRGASLNYLIENGGLITDAVSTQDWPGEANVDVSIVNWVK